MFVLPREIALGGAVTKYRNNINALRILKNPDTAQAHRGELALYSGWGDAAVLKEARRTSYSYDPNDEIKPLLEEGDWESICASALNAHYTSLDIIRAIWEGVRILFPGDGPINMLEPSCGIGHFLGAAPEDMRVRLHRPTLVELDRISATIAQTLYPEAEVIHSGFEKLFRKPSGQRTLTDYYDLAISNVPFGKIHIADPGMRPKAACESIHNYFITRMIELVRPGGYVVAITSRYTLDGTTSGPVCRKAWAEKASLELAVRLPCDAFKANAGTEVVTDILFLRKGGQNAQEWVGTEGVLRQTGTKREGKYRDEDGNIHDVSGPGRTWTWVETPEMTPIPRNTWYGLHPELVLGREAMSGTMYGSWGGTNLEKASMDANALPTNDRKNRAKRWTEEDARKKVGSYNVESHGGALSLTEALTRYLKPTAQEEATIAQESRPGALWSDESWSPTSEQQSLANVYAVAKQVIRLQLERCSDDELTQAQRLLENQYLCALDDNGVKTLSHPRIAKVLKDRPDVLAFLLALETPDGQREAIFTRRTIYPEPEPEHTSDPVDALYRCLDRRGCVDSQWISEALGVSRLQVEDLLGEHVFRDPETNNLVSREEYLSGNVRTKLRAAQSAHRRDSYWERNVKALEAVLPADIPPEDIAVSLKSTWVPARVLCQFVYSLVSPDYTCKHEFVFLVNGSWVLGGFSYPSYGANNWSTARASFEYLLQCGLDGRTPVIYDEDQDGKRHQNQEASVVAQAKLEEIQKAYREYLWADIDRAKELSDVYNDTFNCYVARKWDGSFLTFPGMNTDVDLRYFQRDGVARILFSDRKNHPALIWPTGAGKTFGGIAAVEKRLQLGLSAKVLISVPKHLVNQWADDYRRLFPGRADQILTAGKDSLTKKERGVFLARAATGSCRVVIMSHTQLKALPVKDETFNAIVQEQLQQLVEAIADQESLDNDRGSVPLKRLQALKKNLESRIRSRAESTAKDSSATILFEDLGFDLFLGDEAQAWKNLQLVTRMGNVNGIRTGASQISQDFLCKLRHIQRTGGITVLATATPVANSLAETFVFANYLQNEALQDHGIDSPDAFFSTFTKTYSSVELDPSCAAYRVVSRLEFSNIPELVKILRQSWHVVRSADLGLKLPSLATGKEIVIQTKGSDALLEYVQCIASRVSAIKSGKVQPSEDNMLKVCSDGRWASLVNGPPDGEIRDTKLDRVVEQVVKHYLETDDVKGAQIVFCDLGVPTGETSSDEETSEEALTAEGHVEQSRVYEYVRARLMHAGIPRREIEFLQDHNDPVKLRSLYAKVNSGEVRVLLGSAPTGMNIQERLIALHHIDPVWRPDWKTQRDGRIIRQGNMFETVYIYLYLTEGSFDAYIWGLVRAKLHVIEQVTSGDATVRKIDGDVGDIVLRASEIQALASGNPLVLKFVGVQNELTKLSALRGEFERQQSRMRMNVRTLPQEIARLQKIVSYHRQAIQVRDSHRDVFSVELLGEEYTSRKEAGKALFASCFGKEAACVGEYRGFRIITSVFGQRMDVSLELEEGAPMYSTDARTETGVWTALDTALDKIDVQLSSLLKRLDGMSRDLKACQGSVGKEWDRGSDYARLYTEYQALAKALSGNGVTASEFQRPDTEWVETVPVKVGRTIQLPLEKVRVPRGSWTGPKNQMLLFSVI